MSIFRMTGEKGGVNGELIMPGDIVAGGESLAPGSITTVGAGTWTGAAIASGLIYRTGPVAGYTDTTDSAYNILLSLAGNTPAPDVVPGTTFRLTFINTVAQAMTLAYGTGVIAGLGTQNCAASLVREYLVTVLAPGIQQNINCTTTNGNATVNFVLPPGQTGIPLVGYNALNIMPAQSVSGTGISAGTTVLGIIAGQGGATGLTLSANATATNAVGVSLTFSPTIKLDSIRAGTL